MGVLFKFPRERYNELPSGQIGYQAIAVGRYVVADNLDAQLFLKQALFDGCIQQDVAFSKQIVRINKVVRVITVTDTILTPVVGTKTSAYRPGFVFIKHFDV